MHVFGMKSVPTWGNEGGFCLERPPDIPDTLHPEKNSPRDPEWKWSSVHAPRCSLFLKDVTELGIP